MKPILRLASALFGGQKEKTPVAAGVSININEDQAMAFRLVGDDGKSNISEYVPKGKTDFAKHLRWKLKSSEIEQMVITPEMAEEMLSYNAGNRPCSESVVKRYATQMQKGDWRLVAQPIIFSDAHLLRDGQHRLNAGVMAGVAFPAYVKFGEPDENFAFIDCGKPRGPADIFAINGVENYTTAAAAARWVLAYQSDALVGNKHLVTVSSDDLYKFYLKHSRIQESMFIRQAFKESRLAPPSVMVAFHYICATKNRALADKYFMQIADGVGIESKATAQARLRKILIDNLGSIRGKLPAITIAAYTVKGWNAARQNRDHKVFKWRTEQSPNESFPKVQ